MTENQIVLDWAVALCEQAMKEKNEGNVALLNRIGGNGGLQTFFANAYSTHSVQYSQFHRLFPVQWKEVVGVYEAYQKEQLAEAAQIEKTNSIEERLGKLETLLTSFIESQKPAPVADAKPAKKGNKKPVVEAETEPTEGETSEEA